MVREPVRRAFRAGHRNNPKAGGTGKMSENRFAWIRTQGASWVIMEYEEEEWVVPEGKKGESGKTVMLYLPRPGGRDISFNITSLTKEELDAWRSFFTLLFDEAEPTVIQRDKDAQDALEAGDDSFARVYRTAPQYIVRKRSVKADRQGVHDGSEDLPSGDGGDTDTDRGLRGDSDELAPIQPVQDVSENDGEETD